MQTFMNILDTITAQKRIEIAALYQNNDLETLKSATKPTTRNFYNDIAAAHSQKQPFFICEFKRKSPSEGWINADADLPQQVQAYAQAGAKAISVLTDTSFFGGSYQDLELAAATLHELGENRPLLLQKDFILDEIQIYKARAAGADLILLIAAILTADQLQYLKEIAASVGMGVLVEVHDNEELQKVQHLDFPVLGINNRDLKVFRTSLNRVNVLKKQSPHRFIISESGIYNYRDFAVVRHADGFLIGTGLMRAGAASLSALQNSKYLFKACGIRTADLFQEDTADFIGINFSPVSKRRMPLEILDQNPIPSHAVAVFYQNDPEEIHAILERYPFQRVQLYAGDVTPEFVRSIRKKILLAARVRTQADLDDLENYAADIDLFILDGPDPGSGTQVENDLIPPSFPYPFLLAGGMHSGNLERLTKYQNCIGVDMASGIETDHVVDAEQIRAVLGNIKLL
jgi:indole-3-glycerol phosphate synthase/phosphoribosylanthranilate isomerase/anthranilate synthase/indole-3-glycerol phosphate synthase/phosphoribosylanthranilate isomerase